MSAIAAVNSSATSAVASLLSDAASAATAGGTSASATTKSDQASASRNPVDIVDLSDHAKATLARAKTEQVAADKLDQLVREIRAQRSGKAATYTDLANISAQSDAAATGDETVDAVKAMAKMPEFGSAANGRADDAVRSLVRDGKVPQLPLHLTDGQAAQLSDKEKTLFAIVQGVQGLYDAMPKTLDEALSQHVNQVIDGYPNMINQMKSDIVDGKLPGEYWEKQVTRYESELTAAREGTMKITSETDTRLVGAKSEFTMQRDAIGYSGRGQTTTTSDWNSIINKYGTENIQIGSSPYTTGWVITW
uniref:Uncharacterized protein n=1 Tax=Rhodopseudomonas palustris (strain BisA53) TaxID=316055 RepID=Q07S49_RHOP5